MIEGPSMAFLRFFAGKISGYNRFLPRYLHGIIIGYYL